MQSSIGEAYKKLGGNVYRFRVLHCLTQENLGEKCGVTGSYISQIERADLHKGITCTTMIQISDAFNIPPCILLAQEFCPKYLEYLNNAAINMPINADGKVTFK